MVWFIGGIIYLVLVVTLGVMSIRKGHWVMFIIGIFLPFFWLIGALMPSRRLAYQASLRDALPGSGLSGCSAGIIA